MLSLWICNYGIITMNDIGDIYLLGTIFDLIFITLFMFIYMVYNNTITSLLYKIKISFIVIIIIFLNWISFGVMVLLVCLYLIKSLLNKSCNKKVKMSTTKKRKIWQKTYSLGPKKERI